MEYWEWSRPRNRRSAHPRAPSKLVLTPEADKAGGFSRQIDGALHDRKNRIYCSDREHFLSIDRNPLLLLQTAPTERECLRLHSKLPLRTNPRIRRSVSAG